MKVKKLLKKYSGLVDIDFIEGEKLIAQTSNLALYSRYPLDLQNYILLNSKVNGYIVEERANRIVLIITVDTHAKSEKSKKRYTPEEVGGILIKEGQEHGRKYGFKLGDTIKFSPTEIEKILKAESERK